MRLDPWTIALQTINVLVLVWILAHFLFRPVSAIIAARRAAANALLADAEATRAKAAETTVELTQQRAGLAAEGQRIVAEAQATAEAERATLLHQASDAAARLQAEAAKAIERDRQTMHAALEHEASELAVTIAQRLLERVPARALTRAFLDALAKAVTTHPARASLVGATMELCSAVPLDAPSQAECRAVLADALGAQSDLTFRVDPTLIAGIELTAPHAQIRVSWRADLERITDLLLANHSHDTETQRVA